MLNALAYAFVDAVNVLLIGVLIALAMMLPPGKYRPIAFLLLLGDWLGVLLLSLIVLLAFDGLKSIVETVLDSPLFAILLIATGLVTAVLTIRGGGGSSTMIDRVLTPLKTPSWMTVSMGFTLGLIQSVTSVPFFAGLAVLSTSGLPVAERYLGLFAYATVALSLPLLIALALGVVRRHPHSWIGRLFATARANQEKVATGAGWLVTALLVGLGVARLL